VSVKSDAGKVTLLRFALEVVVFLCELELALHGTVIVVGKLFV
jgi:hypothetical protein